jgi:hypothetical protein
MRLPIAAWSLVSLVQFHGSEYMFSVHRKKKRLHEGGVGPEIRSPAGLVATILGRTSLPVKAAETTRGGVLG